MAVAGVQLRHGAQPYYQRGLTVADLAAAIATIKRCKDIHTQWIEHLVECPGCPSEATAGDIDHHTAINAEYDNVLAVLAEKGADRG